MENKINPFVNFIKQYDISSSDYTKIFDEYTDSNTKKYEIDSQVNNSIINIMKKDMPKSIIITGNAGDGKTRICRNVYEALTGKTLVKWDESGIEEIEYKNKNIRIIKDLSELQDRIIERELLRLQDSLNLNNEYYLIAANEGKLTYSLLKNPGLKSLYELIIKQFNGNNLFSNKPLEVHNLLHTSSSIYALKILQKWNQAENWSICDECKQKKKCVINRNHEMLEKKEVQKLVNRIYRSLDTNQVHLTMRELLIQLSYLHLGGLSCRDIHNARGIELQQQAKKIYYENLFGHSASQDYFDQIPGFEEIKKYDPGLLSNSKVDDFIINGDLSGDNSAIIHTNLFGNNNIDTDYGFFQQELLEYRTTYNTDLDLGTILVSKWLPRLRRKYYFEINLYESSKRPAITNEKNMIVYKFRKEFLDIFRSKTVLPEIRKKLIRGLNYYYSKQIVYSSTDSLYLTNENLFVYRVIELSDFKWEVEMKIENLDRNPGNIYLKIDQGKLKINLLLFEFLMRLANGGLPHILGEDVEILLNNFKNQLIRNYTPNDSTLRILKYDSSKDAYILKSLVIHEYRNTDNYDEEFD